MTPRKVTESLLDEPMYSTAEAARLIGLSTNRVRRWLSGYTYAYEDTRRELEPVIRRPGTEGTSFASFLDLVDLLFVSRFLEHGLSLQKVRKALDEAEHILDTKHFARKSFFTEGSNIFLKMRDEGDAILQLLSDGQWVISEVIRKLAHQIEFDDITELAQRWYPLAPNKLILLDPIVSFGRPHITNKGVATLNIFDFFVAEGQEVRPACRWFDLTKQEVEAAITFEMQMAA